MPEKPNQLQGNKPESTIDEELRIGVYVCECGGNIGDTVRCPLVAQSLGQLPDVAVSREHMFMCSDPAQVMIQKDIKENGINRVVIGACSPFLHEQTFRRAVSAAGLNPYLYTHVGLREQDSWVHHDHADEATEKAKRLMAAGIAKARHLEPLEPIRLEAKKHVLVIGGGVSGLRAALDNARRGLKVTLVEKSPFVGGHMAQLEKTFPNDKPARESLRSLIERVRQEENVTIYTRAEVTGVTGYVGDFNVQIRQHARGFSADFDAVEAAVKACPVKVPDEFNYGLTERTAIIKPFPGAFPAVPAIDWEHCTACGDCMSANGHGDITLDDKVETFEVNVGAAVMATGFRPYEPFSGEYGYGELPQVITLPQLERLLDPDGPTKGDLVWHGNAVRRVAMVHCVGSRQIDGLDQPQPDGRVNDYCSRVCCTATLRAANEIRERFPQVNVFDFYRDIRTYGRGHEEIYRQAAENRVTFFRFLGEEPPQVTKAESDTDYPLLITAKDTLTRGEEIEVPVDLVVLAVGMMPEPVEDLVELFKITPGTDRFLLEVHPKLRPVETAVPGIVLAGTAQGPMNIQESSAAASAASSKAAGLLVKGQVELEPFVARVDQSLCQGSGECVPACPYDGAIQLVPTNINGQQNVQRAVVTPANCKGCGDCVGACPNQAIDLLGWTLTQYDAMVEALTADFSTDFAVLEAAG